MEIFYPVPDFPGYFVTKSGEFYSERHLAPGKSARLLKQGRRGNYRTITFHKNRKQISHPVHSLMLEIFVSLRPIGMWACHGHRGRDDNSIDNLYWATPSQNMRDKKRDGTEQVGENHSHNKLKESNVMWILNHYVRGSRKNGCPALAKKFHVSMPTIYAIVSGRNWSYLRSRL
jgi:hypothetical protein